MAFPRYTRTQLEMVRAIHKARLAAARKIDPRTGEQLGAPYSLLTLGHFLAAHDAIDAITPDETAFGLTLDYYRPTGDASTIALWYADGQHFADLLLHVSGVGRDAAKVRWPGHAPVPVAALDRRAA